MSERLIWKGLNDHGITCQRLYLILVMQVVDVVHFIDYPAMVEEIYRAQRERDEAVMKRLRLANEERDEALLKLKRREKEGDGYGY